MKTYLLPRAIALLCLAVFAAGPASALDLVKIDEHLDYVDRHLTSFYSRAEIDAEPYLYSLIGVIATLETALADRPKDPQILRRLGQAYRMAAATDIGKLLRSLESRREGEIHIPDWGKRRELAMKYLQKARTLSPRDPQVYVALGKTCGASRKEMRKALGYFEKAKSLSGRSPSAEIMKWLAYLYQETGDPDQAIEVIEEYVRGAPADEEVMQLYMRAGMSALSHNTARFPRIHSLLFLPTDYDPQKRYPVLVDLYGLVEIFGYPFPGRPVSLKSFDRNAAEELKLDVGFTSPRSFIVLVPVDFDHGQDYKTWEGFLSLIETCEQRVLSDLEKIRKWYSVDTSRVGLCGFSIGADLSWALSNRHPEVFSGAIVGGSRCGYVDESRIRELARNDARFYFTIAGDDQEVRVKGMEKAKKLLDAAGVDNVYVKPRNGGHRPSILELETAVDYLFFQ